jgi:hypothetical protein
VVERSAGWRSWLIAAVLLGFTGQLLLLLRQWVRPVPVGAQRLGQKIEIVSGVLEAARGLQAAAMQEAPLDVSQVAHLQQMPRLGLGELSS